MSDGAGRAMTAGCLLLAVIAVISGARAENMLVMVAGPVVFVGAGFFFWRRSRPDRKTS